LDLENIERINFLFQLELFPFFIGQLLRWKRKKTNNMLNWLKKVGGDKFMMD
jgi:hypothetical protein